MSDLRIEAKPAIAREGRAVEPSRRSWTTYRRDPPRIGPDPKTGLHFTDVIAVTFRVIGWVILLPFRIVFGTIELLGRLTSLVVGFSMMVLGVALGAGSMVLLGVPMFVIGLILTLRSLD